MPTPHNNAAPGAFAKTVLMPGDPLRSKFIADNYLENAVLVNNTRGVQGYTGTYKGKRVSVMASGMGMPSIGIYSYELFKFYGVENIIRVGTAGMLSQQLKVRDIVLGMSAYTNSNFGQQYGFRGNVAPCCSYALLSAAMEAAKKLGVTPVPGALYSSDIFYDESQPSPGQVLQGLGVLAVEMEAAALFTAGAAEVIAKSVFKAYTSNGATLSVLLYLRAFEDGDFTSAWGIGAVLLVLVLLINLAARLAKTKLKQKQ